MTDWLVHIDVFESEKIRRENCCPNKTQSTQKDRTIQLTVIFLALFWWEKIHNCGIFIFLSLICVFDFECEWCTRVYITRWCCLLCCCKEGLFLLWESDKIVHVFGIFIVHAWLNSKYSDAKPCVLVKNTVHCNLTFPSSLFGLKRLMSYMFNFCWQPSDRIDVHWISAWTYILVFLPFGCW